MSGGGSSTPSATSQTVQQNTIDPAMVPYYTNIAQQAQALGNSAYTPYKGDQVAQFTPLQQQAQTNVQGMQAPAQFGQATQAYDQAANPFTAQSAAQYMNPYAQDVVSGAIQTADQQAAQQNAIAGLQGASSGGYGSSGQAIMNAMNARTLEQTTGNLYNQGMSQAYTNAEGQFNADQARMMQAGQGLGALGAQQQASALALNSAQQQTGATQQALQQQNNTTAYQNFLNQRDWQKNQLGWEAGVIKGVPTGSAENYLTYQPSAPTLNQVSGLAGAALSAYNKA